jgi:hypothetical protein
MPGASAPGHLFGLVRRGTAARFGSSPGGARRDQDVHDGRLRLLPGAVHPGADDRLLPAGFTHRAGGRRAKAGEQAPMLGKWPNPNKLSEMYAWAAGLWIRRVLVRAEEGQYGRRRRGRFCWGSAFGSLPPSLTVLAPNRTVDWPKPRFTPSTRRTREAVAATSGILSARQRSDCQHGG